jgi:hypothetical protein
VGAVRRDHKTLRAHPLIQEGEKLIPSVTRVFRRDQNLFVYAEAYDTGRQEGAPAPSLLASLQFFRDNVQTFSTQPARISKVSGTKTPIELSVPLQSLAPGRYTVQLSVVDEIGKKFVFVRSAIVILEARPEATPAE